jgi:bifunctional UDP-N-acetylglucosamine pyrophosphorylase/glucosamine-1-phosphate N-acetyltransferase
MSQAKHDSAAAVVLAAGKGTRLESARAKALFELGGRPLVWYPIAACQEAGIDRIVVVVGHQAELVRAAAGEGCEFVLQEPQLGTAHALAQCRGALADFAGTIVVLYADTPMVDAVVVAEFLSAHQAAAADADPVPARYGASVLTAVLADGGDLGRIVRGDGGEVLAIVERRDCTPEQAAIKEVNTGSYCFQSPLIFEVLDEIRPENAQAEYYLTDAIAAIIARGRWVQAVAAPSPEVALGINTRAELARAEALLRERTCQRLMLAGVSIVDPASAFIDPTAEIGRDTVIQPWTLIRGRTRVGRECLIGPGTTLVDASVGDRAKVIHSTVWGGRVPSGARVGPFEHIGAPATERVVRADE